MFCLTNNVHFARQREYAKSNLWRVCHCQRHTLRMRIICSLHTHTQQYTQPHTHTHTCTLTLSSINAALTCKFCTQKGFPSHKFQFPIPTSTSTPTSISTWLCFHSRLAAAAPAPLKSASCNTPEIVLPELSLRVEAAAYFAHFAKISTNKKETKTIKCRTKSPHYFPLRLNSAPITVPPPLHSPPPLLPSFVARKGCLALRLAPKVVRVVHVVQVVVVLAVLACFGFFA